MYLCPEYPLSYLLFQSVLHSWCNKEGNVLFNDALNTFYIWLYGISHMVKDHSAREETRCHHMGCSFRLAARVLLYASSHRQDNTYHSLCYTSRGALAGTMKDRSDDPSHHERTLCHRATSRSWCNKGSDIYYPVCGMVYIKDHLLLIGKSSPCP